MTESTRTRQDPGEDYLDVARATLFRERQLLMRARLEGHARADFREQYRRIREEEARLEYEELKRLNRIRTEPLVFSRPRKEVKSNERLRRWTNYLILLLLLVVVFFSVMTPRLKPPSTIQVEEINDARPPGEMFP